MGLGSFPNLGLYDGEEVEYRNIPRPAEQHREVDPILDYLRELNLPKNPEAEARIEARVKETKEKCLDDAARGVTDPAEIATKYMLSATMCDAEAETKDTGEKIDFVEIH